MNKKKLKYILINFFRSIFSINGLIATILIGIFISLFSFIIQDQIQRQRYLELLELEIRQNYSATVIEINNYNKTGIIQNHTPYSDEVFKAGLQSGYLLTVDPQVLGQIYLFYNLYLPKMNNLISKESLVIDNYQNAWEKCVDDNYYVPKNCSQEKNVAEMIQKQYSKYMYDGDMALSKILYDLGLKFNPTKDRLNSPVLRLFMGTQSLGSQK